jgi:serine/threonine protein kinase
MASNIHNSPLSNQPLYEEISVIGTGAYGAVYKGYDLKTSKIVAMKRIRIQITEEGLPIMGGGIFRYIPSHLYFNTKNCLLFDSIYVIDKYFN